ncbi:Protein UNC-3 protein3 [Aphelenchoides avenae]|nr:Protein UNC-3 protein3 [Aphelenchus avenae]
MFETSSAMLELFGGTTKTAGAGSCFEQIPPVKEDGKKFGRRNLLQRENQQESEWNDIRKNVTTAAPCFQTIEDHDKKYEETRRRGNWESSSSQFETIGGRPLGEPGPELFESEPSPSAPDYEKCPAEEVLKRLSKPSALRYVCVSPICAHCLQTYRPRNGMHLSSQAAADRSPDERVEVVVTEEFVSNEIGRKPEVSRRQRLTEHSKTVNEPGPELVDGGDYAEAEEHSSNDAHLEEASRVAQLQMEHDSGHAPCESKAADFGRAALGTMDTTATAAQAAGMTLPHENGRGNAAVGSIVGGAGMGSAGDKTAGAAGQALESAHNASNGVVSQGAGGQNGTDGSDEPLQMVTANGEASTNGTGGGGATAILIKGGQIVNDDAIFVSDILIEDDKIQEISSSLSVPENAEVIDASGKWVLPAGVDVHTEFSAAGATDDFSSGTKAAIAGGTTTIIDVVSPNTGESLVAAFDRVRAAAEAKSSCSFALSVLVLKWDAATRDEMEKLVREKGVNSFILELFSDADLLEAFEHAKQLGAHVRILPENRNLISALEKRMLRMGITGPEGYAKARPAQLEGDWVGRVCTISQLANCPVSVMSVSSVDASRTVDNCRRIGALVNAEVPVAALCASSVPNILSRIPARSGQQNADSVLDLLANGPLSMCVSDHKGVKPSSAADFTKMSVGSTGAEERMSLLWEKAVTTGRIDPMRFVAVTSTNAAKVFNIYPKKGRIAVGSDADLVVWDVESRRHLSAKTHHSAVDASVYEGESVTATPLITINAGAVKYRNGHLSTSGKPQFLALQPNSPYTFSMVQLREKQLGKLPAPSASFSQPRTDADKRQETRPHTTATSRNERSAGEPPKRSTTKVIHPPGGKSTALW